MRTESLRLIAPLSLAAAIIGSGCTGNPGVEWPSAGNGALTATEDIVVRDTTSDAWTADVEPVCEPSCNEARECGSDGCGGTCGAYAGACPDGKSCDGTSCITNPCPSGFVLIPAWTYTMGSAWHEPGRETGGAGETPHKVTITKPFCMAEAELTNAEWLAVTGKSPSYFATAGGTIPVQNISWFDAVTFCNMKSAADSLTPCYEMTGETGTFSGGCVAGQIQCGSDFGYETVTRVESCTGYRLPTEAEWELAARAGVSTDPSKYTTPAPLKGLECQADITDIKDVAWYCGNASATYETAYDCHNWSPLETCGPQPVKGKSPNAWGLYDMLGNVFEFCQDYYTWLGLDDAVDPVRDSPGYNLIIRGGSWAAMAAFARFGSRAAMSPVDRGDVGLRLVLAVPVTEGGTK